MPTSTFQAPEQLFLSIPNSTPICGFVLRLTVDFAVRTPL